jgi:hypothetical protein
MLDEMLVLDPTYYLGIMSRAEFALLEGRFTDCSSLIQEFVAVSDPADAAITQVFRANLTAQAAQMLMAAPPSQEEYDDAAALFQVYTSAPTQTYTYTYIHTYK